MQLRLDLAQKVLAGGRFFYTRFFSLHDDLLVCKYDYEDEFGKDDYFLGTRLVDGNLVPNEKEMVTLKRVKPIIDENTKFEF